jgi:hypothetical protein
MIKNSPSGPNLICKKNVEDLLAQRAILMTGSQIDVTRRAARQKYNSSGSSRQTQYCGRNTSAMAPPTSPDLPLHHHHDLTSISSLCPQQRSPSRSSLEILNTAAASHCNGAPAGPASELVTVHELGCSVQSQQEPAALCTAGHHARLRFDSDAAAAAAAAAAGEDAPFDDPFHDDWPHW